MSVRSAKVAWLRSTLLRISGHYPAGINSQRGTTHGRDAYHRRGWSNGSAGGGLVRAILADPAGQFRVRALTRNPDSDKAKEVEGLGAEIVQADLDDPESLDRAFSGAYGVCPSHEPSVFRGLRGVPSHELLGAFLRGEGSFPGPRHGRGSQTGGGPACHLVNPRGHPTVGPTVGRPHAHPDGALQGPTLRWQGLERRTPSSAKSDCRPLSSEPPEGRADYWPTRQSTRWII